ncbi:putative replicase [Cassava Ivorian bacilliform virus]|uniref:putative replicase n=1 Tax=Cassava Ivorian bacilliform virus TaxID=1464778 RepID=UPI0003F210F0|nr:putative replicase [Cassava Ivorian bacilliform virus]AHJ89005.1 putative replicase [Cassava Ivorian bacilliform virus]
MAFSFNVRDLVDAEGSQALGVRALVDSLATKLAEDQIEYQKRSQKVYVRQMLTVQEGEKIRKRFGGAFDLALTQEFVAPHSFAAALRTCETLECLDFFPQGQVLDFGGSWLFHWQRGHQVHSCCPVLDIRDACRHQERIVHMQKLVLKRPSKFEALPAADFCTLRAEECKVQCPYAICIHGAYDMGFETMCKAMNRHGTVLLRGTMMFDSEMLLYKEGFMADLNCVWSISGDRISFDFRDESTLSYTHSFKNVKSFLTDQAFVYNNVAYLLERCSIEYGIMSFKITAVSGDVPRSRIRHCVWFPRTRDYLHINVVDTTSNRLAWRKVKVKIDTVREVEEIAFRCFKEAKPWEENLRLIASTLSAKSSTIIVNGMSMMAGERLDVLDYHYVAFSLLLNCKRKFEELQCVYKKIVWQGRWHHCTRWWSEGDRFQKFLESCFPSLLEYYNSKVFVEKIVECQVFESELEAISGCTNWTETATNCLNNSLLLCALALSKAPLSPENPKPETVADPRPEVSSDDKIESVETKDAVKVDGRMELRAQAKAEFVAYTRTLNSNAASNLKRLWQLCGGDGSDNFVSTECLNVLKLGDSQINFHKSSGWIFPTSTSYEVGYNGRGLGVKGETENYIVDKTCTLDNLAAIADGAEKKPVFQKRSSCLLTVSLGCGKTTSIINQFDANSDLIVTANRKSAVEIRNKLFEFSPDLGKKFVRTADSVLMHDCITARRLLFDEVGLLHFGQLVAVAGKVQADVVLGFGDSEQIAFINRDKTFDLKYSRLSVDESTTALTTYRCPRDVVELVKVIKEKTPHSKYHTWETKSSVSRSVSAPIDVIGLPGVKLEPDWVYLTMTQYDKASLLSKARELHLDVVVKDVNEMIKTVHEGQGLSVPKVRLVRLKNTKCDLFSAEAHCLVALTRHTQKFEYLRVPGLKNDLIEKACKASMSLQLT